MGLSHTPRAIFHLYSYVREIISYNLIIWLKEGRTNQMGKNVSFHVAETVKVGLNGEKGKIIDIAYQLGSNAMCKVLKCFYFLCFTHLFNILLKITFYHISSLFYLNCNFSSHIFMLYLWIIFPFGWVAFNITTMYMHVDAVKLLIFWLHIKK